MFLQVKLDQMILEISFQPGILWLYEIGYMYKLENISQIVVKQHVL